MPGFCLALLAALATVVPTASCLVEHDQKASVIELTYDNFDQLTSRGEWLLTISAPWWASQLARRLCFLLQPEMAMKKLSVAKKLTFSKALCSEWYRSP